MGKPFFTRIELLVTRKRKKIGAFGQYRTFGHTMCHLPTHLIKYLINYLAHCCIPTLCKHGNMFLEQQAERVNRIVKVKCGTSA